MRSVYKIQPLSKGISSFSPPLNENYTNPVWPSNNFRIKQNSIQKRWGYSTTDRDLGDAVEINTIATYNLIGGSKYTMILTPADLILRETSAGKTWSYKTDTYTTGNITDISGAAVTGSGTSWDTSEVAAGDKFILTEDHTYDAEPAGGDADWRTIQTVGGATSITLSAAYGKDIAATSKTYKIRKVYTTPTNERWSWSVVNDKFCFTNGNTNVQYWSGSNYASDLDTAAVAVKARYCTTYANRLFIADYGASRNPLGVAHSAENDPTDWTAATYGEYDLIETQYPITGLGRAGANLIVYKTDAIVIGNRTGVSTSPIAFSRDKVGVGMIAPKSLVEFMGMNAFLWRDDFYMIESDTPVSIGSPVRDLFFSIVTETEVERVFGFNNIFQSEILWRANTTAGQFWFVWNYKTNDWYVYQFANTMFSGGRGVV